MQVCTEAMLIKQKVPVGGGIKKLILFLQKNPEILRPPPPHYGLTGHAIKNLKMPKKVRQDNKQAGTENVFCQKWKIIFSK